MSEQETDRAETGGRRSDGRRRVSPTAVIAVLLPLLTVGALALVEPFEQTTPSIAAEQVPPTQVDLVCPTGEGSDEVVVSTTGRGGDVEVTPAGGEPSDLALEPDAVASLPGGEPTFLQATGGLAAELIGARVREDGLTSAECVLPRPEYWITGLGAGADHASVLELANPDQGPAVADVQVWGRAGLVDVPALRGLTVPGGESTRLDLAEVVPRRSELAVHVVVSRGRLGATALDQVPALGSRPATAAWVPAAGEPATDQLLLGLARGEGEDTLVVSNPGEDEARVELRIVTEDASFVPEGQEELRVSPGSVETVTLTETLRQQVADGALGLQLVSTAPVTTTLRSTIGDDLVHAPVATPTAAATTALLPPGEARLVLARAGKAGVAVVASYDARGRELGEERIELRNGTGGTVDLPEGTRLVRVTPRRTDVAGSVVVTGQGATVVPLREVVRSSLIPDVRPGLDD
jgi:hypothetical protein